MRLLVMLSGVRMPCPKSLLPTTEAERYTVVAAAVGDDMMLIIMMMT